MTRRAIVTGGGSGIGRASAIALARAGCDVGITFNANAAGAGETRRAIERLGRRAAGLRVDFGEPGVAGGAIGELADMLGGVDVLVNNAAINPRAEALEETIDGWTQALAVNLISPWACAREAAERMIAAGRGGRIINVTSILASVPLAGGSAYCASKSALQMLTEVLALELARHSITVNAVAPGHTATPINYPPEELANATKTPRPVIPVARAAAPEEIAAAVLYLASPEASYSTGASVLVDGGLMLASGPNTLQDEMGRPPQREERP